MTLCYIIWRESKKSLIFDFLKNVILFSLCPLYDSIKFSSALLHFIAISLDAMDRLITWFVGKSQNA